MVDSHVYSFGSSVLSASASCISQSVNIFKFVYECLLTKFYFFFNIFLIPYVASITLVYLFTHVCVCCRYSK